MADQPATFSVGQAGSFLPIGGFYWTRQSPDPEPVNAHGPYLFGCLAVQAARKALGADARQVTQ